MRSTMDRLPDTIAYHVRREVVFKLLSSNLDNDATHGLLEMLTKTLIVSVFGQQVFCVFDENGALLVEVDAKRGTFWKVPETFLAHWMLHSDERAYAYLNSIIQHVKDGTPVL